MVYKSDNMEYIFLDSMFGVSVGVLKNDIRNVYVDIEPYKLPEDSVSFTDYRMKNNLAFGQEIANVNVYQGDFNKYDKEVILRVYISCEEISQGYKNIFAHKAEWKNWGGSLEDNYLGRWWGGYIEVKVKIGDPPIAVG